MTIAPASTSRNQIAILVERRALSMPIYTIHRAVKTTLIFLLALLTASIVELVLRPEPNTMSHYNNTCLGITSQATPDPFITYARGKFYFMFTAGNRVPLWEADSITDFGEEGRFKKGPVW